ncbi:VG15 protein [Mycolicibacterium setense]
MTAPTLVSGLEAVTALALADLADVWELPPETLSVALMDLLPAAADTFGVATAALAADWYDELREAEEIPGDFRAIVPVLELGGDALAGWATEPLRAAEPDIEIARFRAEGGLQKRMANAANLTLTTSATEDPQARGYMRRTRPNACRFCVMVASRGGVFTRASATFACHERCYCEAVPAWGGRPRPVGPYKRSDRPSTPEDRARVRAWIADNL